MYHGNTTKQNINQQTREMCLKTLNTYSYDLHLNNSTVRNDRRDREFCWNATLTKKDLML